MKIYMDDIIVKLEDSNGVGFIDPIYYLQKSHKWKLYLQKLEKMFEVY